MTKKIKSPMAEFTTKTFERQFPDSDACLEWLKDYRWPDGIDCPICKKVTKHHKMPNRSCYKCDYCGHDVYPMANTIFHKSATPLKTWFQAMYYMSSTRSGRSAKELQRMTGVTYKTAWRMFKQIRILFDENAGMFTNEVEIDETYIGGKRRGDNQGRPAEGSHKVPVIGIAQRNGKVSVKAVANVKRSTVMPLIAKNVERKTIIYTDEYKVYDKVEDAGFNHVQCNHAAGEYVVGNAHTNTIEGFWSLVKRGIGGVYHAVSPKYLQSYLNEYQFRYNHRLEERPMFLTMLHQIR
jgi:transposase-like protein